MSKRRLALALLLVLATAGIASAAATIHVSSRVTAISGTGYSAVGDGMAEWTATEAFVRRTMRSPGTISNMFVRLTANATVGSPSEIVLRLNGADTLLVVIPAASTTGEFENNVNSITIADGDEVAYRATPADNSFTFGLIASLFTPTTNTVTLFANSGGDVDQASTSRYQSPSGGEAVWNATEAQTQRKIKVAGTLRDMGVNVVSNARTTDTDFRSRINGAFGNLLVRFAGLTTGYLEDNTASDTVAINDLVNYSYTTGTGTELLDVTFIGSEFETTTGASVQSVSSPAGVTVSQALTRYFTIGGRSDAITTETFAQVEPQRTITYSGLEVYVSANTVSAASFLRLRNNAGNLNQVAEITANTTGLFEDPGATDAVAADANLAYQLITGTGGTSLTIRHITMFGDVPAGAGNKAGGLVNTPVLKGLVGGGLTP